MLKFVTLLSFVALSWADSCCPPLQWEGVMSIATAEIPDGQVIPDMSESQFAISVDSSRHISITVGTYTAKGFTSVVSTLTDYANDVTYQVVNGNCTKKPAGPYPGYCVPDNATKSADTYLGVGANSLRVNQYTYSIGGSMTYLTVNDECVPVGETILTMADNKHSMTQILFNEIKGGIADQAVFNLPKECALIAGNNPMPSVIG